MIEVKPQEIIDNKVCFIATEDGENTGTCQILLDGYYVEILSVIAPEDKPYISELLLRSALNYAANRNAYMARTKLNDFPQFSFEKKEDYYESDIPSLLVGSCGG